MIVGPGSRLGEYLVGDVIGAGGWGTVYVATHLPSGRRVAIKVLRDDAAPDGEPLARFEREARAIAALDHPNIVKMSDFGAAVGGPSYFVMDYLEGSTLGTLLHAGPLSASRTVRIATQVLSALEVAHAAGIVHRDIKPENIFLVPLETGRPLVKVLDFGIARLEGAAKLTVTGTVIGTPAYMPPEQALGDPVDARADIYAVGATMYRALAGRPAFSGRDMAGMLAAIIIGDRRPLGELRPDLDPSLVAIIERAMNPDPALRFASAAEMRSALLPKPRSVRPPVTRTAWSILGIAAVVVLAGLVVLAALIGNRIATLARAGTTQPPDVQIAAASSSQSDTATLGAPDASTDPAPSSSPLAAASPTAHGASPLRMSGRAVQLRAVTAGGLDVAPMVAKATPAVTKCFAAAEFEPPRHELLEYRVKVFNHAVIAVAREGGRGPEKLDWCIIRVLQTLVFADYEGHADVDVTYYAPL